MKRFAVIAAALCVAIMMAVPASALEITTDGYYRARYIGAWNVKMTDQDDVDNGGNSYGDMRLRINNVIKVNDNLSLRTRFRAANTVWGTGGTELEWKRAWMVARFNFGIMEVGRMQGGTWGTSFADTERDADRIKFTIPMGPVTLLAIYEKIAERDNQFKTVDTDKDALFLAGVWKAETMSAGLLGAWIPNKINSDLIPQGTASALDNRTYANQYALLPFFTGKWGAFGFQAEGRWDFGKAKDFVDEVRSDGSINKDGDFKGWSLNLEGSFDFGMGSAQLGYAYVTGQERDYVNGVQVYSNDVTGGQIGADWAKLYILTGDTGPTSGTGALGGIGAFGAGGNPDGISLLYGGADFKPMENLSLGFMLGWGKANETWDGQDTDLGWEIDLIAKYTIFDNLTNTFKVAYLGSGDYWKGSKYDDDAAYIDDKFDKDVWAIFNELKLSF